jgi:hypothetical protein
MKLTTTVTLNPGGFSDVDVFAHRVEVSMPELAHFKSGEHLSSAQVAIVRERAEAHLNEIGGKVARELNALGAIAAEHEPRTGVEEEVS